MHLGKTCHFSLLLVGFFCLPLQLLIVLRPGCWALNPQPPPPSPPLPPSPAATSHTENKSSICALAWLWAVTPDAATIDPVPSSRQEAKWLWFITLMHICCLAHGVFVCQLLKTHKPSSRVIFLFKQQGLAVLQQKHSKQLPASALSLAVYSCMLISQTVPNSSWRGPKRITPRDLLLLRAFFHDDNPQPRITYAFL